MLLLFVPLPDASVTIVAFIPELFPSLKLLGYRKKTTSLPIGSTYILPRMIQFSLGTFIQISDVVPLLSVPFPVIPISDGVDQPESP